MGSSVSILGGNDKEENYVRLFNGGCDTCGGEKFFGADDKLDLANASEYVNSINSKTKEKIFKEIVSVARDMGLIFRSSAPEEQLKELMAQLPKSDKLKQDPITHKKTCVGIANAINKIHGDIININAAPEIICQQVAENLQALSTGMYSEFLVVASDVRMVIKNLHTLKDVLIQVQKEYKKKIVTSSDSILLQQVGNLDEVHDIVMKEIDRQLELLNGLLSANITATEETLGKFLQQRNDISAHVAKIDVKPGSDKFGKIIADILAHMGVTAYDALLTDKALKVVGMTIKDYAAATSERQLLDKILEKVTKTNMTDEQLHEYIKAATMLFNNLGKNIDIAAVHDRAISGAAEYAKTDMDRRIKDRKTLRNLVFTAFYKNINDTFNQFVASLNVLSMKVGTADVPISDQLSNLRRILVQFKSELIQNKNVYYALIGYYNDAASRAHKDQVVADLKMVNSVLDTIMEMPAYSKSKAYFAQVHSHVDNMLHLIERYTEDIAAKFGRGEECPAMEKIADEPDYGAENDNIGELKDLDKAEKSGSAQPISITAGAIDDVPRIVIRSPKTIEDAIRQFDYRYTVAQIYKNLESASKELPSYSENYEKLLAHSVADILAEDQKKYKILGEILDREDAEFAAKTSSGDSSPDKDTAAKNIAAAREFLDEIWEVKKKFWSTLQAVDIYMDKFTSDLVSNPNDVKEIVSMLDEVKTISDWYNGDTGDYIAKMFEEFPTANFGVSTAKGFSNAKYYEKVSTDIGKPHNVANPVDGKVAKEHAQKAIGMLSSLKNLLSIFAHIGNQELKKQIFMSPNVMYNNLVDYLRMSTFAQGFNIGDIAENVSAQFNDDANLAVMKGSHTVGETVNMPSAPLVKDSVHSAKVANKKLLRKRWGIWIRSATIDELRNAEGFGFKLEDEYFPLIIKAMCAKVLTVVGLYDVFDRPMEFNGISNVRMILGGDNVTPKVDVAAVPLYLRLPLLAQFYRDMFDLDGLNPTSGNDFVSGAPIRRDGNVKIALVPDIDGTFSNLIKIVFQKTKFINHSAYNDEDAKELIAAINVIHQKMAAKHGSNFVAETINEFVAEINRRYGIVSEKDRKSYEAEFGLRYDYADVNQYDEGPDNDYAILPDEELDEIRRLSPAERLLGLNVESGKEKISPYTINVEHKKLIYKFRCILDKYFENATEDFSFNNSIKLTQSKLARETSDENRFKIVAALMRGVDVNNRVDAVKYILFHETVITGLNTLSAIHTMLANFKRRIVCIDMRLIEEVVWDILSSKDNNTYGVMGLSDKIKDKIMELRVFSDKKELKNIDRIFGSEENFTMNGGKANKNDNARHNIKNTSDAINVNREGRILVGNLLQNEGNSIFAVLENKNGAALKKAYFDPSDNSDNKKAAKTFMRYFINRDFVMREIVELLLGISGDSNGLVEFRIEDGNIMLNYGKLRTLIDELFQHVSYFMDLLRPHVSAEIMDQYTRKNTPGSFYWLQEQLMEKIIIGRPRGNNENIKPAQQIEYANLDTLMRKLSYTYSNITQLFDVDGNKISQSKTFNVANSQNEFGRLFAGMIFYDGGVPQSGIIHTDESLKLGSVDKDTAVAGGGVKIVDYLYDPYESLHFEGPVGAKLLDTRFVARFSQLYSWGPEFTWNRSALYAFNQLIAKFIQAFYDPASKKMYIGLLNQFANGSFNRAIADQSFTYPDVVPAWFVKPSGNGEYKIPNNDLLEASVRLENNSIIAPAVTNIAKFINQNRDFVHPRDLNEGDYSDITGQNGGNYNTALSSYPFDTWVGRNRDETLYRIKTFVVLYQLTAEGVPEDTINGLVRGIKSTYLPADGKLDYIVKYEDMLRASKDFFYSPTVPVSNDYGHIIIASDDAVRGAYPEDSLSKLGAPTQKTDKKFNAIEMMNYGNRMDTDGEHVLFTSLSVIIKNLMNSRTSQQSLANLHENVADIPIYMREKMRANLPAFVGYFKALVCRCECLKKLINEKRINLSRYFDVVPSHNPWPHVLKPVVTDSVNAKSRFTSILDSIINGCNSLIEGCNNTLREIGDDPKYFEVNQGSIREYRNKNGTDPFMPLSTVLVPFKNITADNYMQHFPIHSMGTEEFKFLYGTRGLFGGSIAPTLENNAGFSSIIEGFNMISEFTAADKGKSEAFLKSVVAASKFIYELKHVKGLITTHITNVDHPNINKVRLNDGAFNRCDLLSPTKIEGNTTDKSLSLLNKNCVFAIVKPLVDSIRLVESSLKDEKMKEFVEFFVAARSTENSLIVQNIIDLNIVPINVHALKKGIPLANIYNYAYSCDRFFIEFFYGLNEEKSKQKIRELCPDNDVITVENAEDMLVALLINPYRKVDNQRDLVRQVLLGVPNNIEFGRPKFLSDELAGKVLLGNVYDEESSINEMGPSAAASLDKKMRNLDKKTRIVMIAASYMIVRFNEPKYMNYFGIAKGLEGFCINMANAIVQRKLEKNTISDVQLAEEITKQILSKLPNRDQTMDADIAKYLVTFCSAAIQYQNSTAEDIIKTIDPTIKLGKTTIRELLPNVIKIVTGLKTFDGKKLVEHNVSLEEIGNLRFDTVFIRNMLLITNAYRTLRAKLHRDLVYTKEVVARSLPITNFELTEFSGNDVYKSQVRYGSTKRGSEMNKKFSL